MYSLYHICNYILTKQKTLSTPTPNKGRAPKVSKLTKLVLVLVWGSTPTPNQALVSSTGRLWRQLSKASCLIGVGG